MKIELKLHLNKLKVKDEMDNDEYDGCEGVCDVAW